MLSVNVNVKIRSPLFAFEKQMYFQKHHSSGFLNVSSFLNQRYSCELVKLLSVYQQTNWDFHALKWFTIYLLCQIWLQVYRSISLKSLMLYYLGSSFIYRRCHYHDRRHFVMMLTQVLFHLHGPVGNLYRIKEQSLVAEPDLWPPCEKRNFASHKYDHGIGCDLTCCEKEPKAVASIHQLPCWLYFPPPATLLS